MLAISAVAREGYLPYGEQRDLHADCPQGNQGIGTHLEGTATVASVMRVSLTSSLDGVRDSIPRVFELDDCKHLIPRIWICAVTKRTTALAPLSEPLLDLVKVAQRNDPRYKNIVEKRLGKRNADGKEIWSMDSSGLVRFGLRAVMPEDLALRGEVMKLHHDDPLAGHYGVEKTLELLRRSWYWENMETDVRDYCRECDVCQRVKAKRHKPYGLLGSLP